MKILIVILIFVGMPMITWALCTVAKRPYPQRSEVIHGIEEMAERTGKSYGTIRIWIHEKAFRCYRWGGHYWCYADDLMEFNAKYDQMPSMAVVAGGIGVECGQMARDISGVNYATRRHKNVHVDGGVE